MSTSYEAAPATRMVATHCAVCARPLLDAESVERGIGPECARKYGFEAAQGPARWSEVEAALSTVMEREVAAETVTERWDNDARRAANALVHWIACEQSGRRVGAYVRAIDALGFGKLARRIAERLGAVTVEADGDVLVVTAPYSELFVTAARRVPGARFDRERGARVVPASSRRALWEAIRSAFGPGTIVAGTRIAIV